MIRSKKKAKAPVGIPTTPSLNPSDDYDYPTSPFGLGSKRPPKTKRKARNGSTKETK